MRIEKSELLSAAAKIGVSESQAEQLWSVLSREDSGRNFSKFDLSNVLYYLGAMIVVVAMGWFLGISWERFGSGAVLSITLAYMLLFFIVGAALWRREDLKIPGGILMTTAVCLIPLAVYSFQKWTGWWTAGEPGQHSNFLSWVQGGWFAMEIATVIGGCLVLYFYRFPFLTAPIYCALWVMSMDVTPLFFGNSDSIWENGSWVSLAFGFALLITAYLTDLRARRDFAFWGYLFGVIAFWSGLSLIEFPSEFDKFLYCLVNVGMVLLSVLLQRSVFLVFGAIGILSYITALFGRYFAESTWFPLLLSLVGILVIFIGIMYHKNRQKIEVFIFSLIPLKVRSWLPKRIEMR